MKSKRKQIQEKFIKFATRIPVFMYLTDYRERCLKDVIIQLEPSLFKKVTGIAKQKPIYFVMRDASTTNDNVIDNFEQIFRHYSPETTCRERKNNKCVPFWIPNPK